MWQNNNKLQRKTMPTGNFHANFFFEMSPSKEPRMKRFVFVCCLPTLFVEQHTSRVLTLSFFYCFLWSEVFPHPATIKSFLMFAMVLNVATCHFLSAPLIITAHHTRKTRTGETNEFPSYPPLYKPRTRVRRRTFPRQFVLPCNSNYSNLACVSFSYSVQRNLWGLI